MESTCAVYQTAVTAQLPTKCALHRYSDIVELDLYVIDESRLVIACETSKMLQ